jgi:hypothetical protein
MEQTIDRSNERVQRTLDQEFALVRDAIAMVASGASPRVTVASLRFGEQLLEAARHLAVASGVRIVPLWTADEAGADIVVERGVDE